MYFELGNLDKALTHSLNSIEHSDFLPLGPYEYLARIAAKNGEHDKAYEWMEKLRKLEIKFMFFSLAQDSIGKSKRDAAIRIYLELGEYKLSEQEMKKPYPINLWVNTYSCLLQTSLKLMSTRQPIYLVTGSHPKTPWTGIWVMK